MSIEYRASLDKTIFLKKKTSLKVHYYDFIEFELIFDS